MRQKCSSISGSGGFWLPLAEESPFLAKNLSSNLAHDVSNSSTVNALPVLNPKSSVWVARAMQSGQNQSPAGIDVRGGARQYVWYPKSHPSHRIMESSCAEPPQFWHPNASSCCATSSRPISSLRRFGGGSATFPSSNKASSRSSSFSDGCSIAEARSTAAAAEAFSRRRSSSFSFFVDAASLALLAGDSVAVRFLCVSKGSSHFWYSCFSAEASEALASVPSSPLAIVRHSLPRHARSKPPWLATTDSYNTRRSSLRPPNTGHLVTVWCSCVCMNSTYSTLQLRCLPFATRSCSSVTVCTRVLNVNEARS
mmetsp:Transcript_4483/g.16613  ORF Transcript_4483/g.16613 Transcript_4483/m.16613 type:complete len:311 (+) Transcript_4483:8946-9878(+)